MSSLVAKDYEPDSPEENERRRALQPEGLHEVLDLLHWVAGYISDFMEMTPLGEVRVGDAPAELEKTLHLLARLREPEVADVWENLTAKLVHRATQLNGSWVDIGKSLDMTPQGVYKLHKKRYGS